MLYTCNNPVREILTVGRFSWNARSLAVEPRPFCALAFRLEGGGYLRCGGRTYTLEPGTVLYMPQNLGYEHDYTRTDILLFHFIAEKNDPVPEVYRLKNADEVQRQFQRAMDIWEEKGPGYMGKCMSILYKILGLLAENEAAIRLPPHFMEAVRLLGEHYRSSDLRIGDICTQAAISQTVFRQLFKKHYGKTPMDHVTDLRLENARNLIAGGTSVETAALDSGFSDAKYFSRVVKQRLGCTPRQLKTYGN